MAPTVHVHPAMISQKLVLRTARATSISISESRWLNAGSVAVVEAILRLERVVHAPYYALFLVGPAANVIEIWWTGREKKKTAPHPLEA